jgi:hypothetical protein
VLMPSTPFAYPQVISRTFASFHVPNPAFPLDSAILRRVRFPAALSRKPVACRPVRSRGRAWINISSTPIGDAHTACGRRPGARERRGRIAVAIVDSSPYASKRLGSGPSRVCPRRRLTSHSLRYGRRWSRFQDVLARRSRGHGSARYDGRREVAFTSIDPRRVVWISHRPFLAHDTRRCSRSDRAASQPSHGT